MTTKEAINDLKSFINTYLTCCGDGEEDTIAVPLDNVDVEAFHMAVKVLEQEPCEDAISRKKVMNQIFYSTDNSGDVVLGSNLRKRIEELPPVMPTRKKGKWIKVKNGRGGHECSICQMYAPSYQSGDEYLSRFCPNCGAEMEGEE